MATRRSPLCALILCYKDDRVKRAGVGKWPGSPAVLGPAVGSAGTSGPSSSGMASNRRQRFVGQSFQQFVELGSGKIDRPVLPQVTDGPS